MQYTIPTPNASPATCKATTAITILSMKSTSAIGALLVEFGVFFTGVNSAAEPVLVELCKWTTATAGTSTAVTPIQSRGVVAAATIVGACNYSAEPTVIEPLKPFLVPPTSGITVQFPLGREPEAIAGTKGLLIRCTAPEETKVRGYMEFVQGPS